MSAPAPRPFAKLLIANRGEIARRVIAACRRRGLASVAVFSDADAEAPFVAGADESVPLRGVAAAETYLDVEKLIAAARRGGADAIHPGYGFLAESPELARAAIDAGLVWVGPPPEAIAAMGSKVRARALMEEAGVPVVPGHELGEGGDAAAAAEEVGYPLLVKASAGGGGKGMRPVASADELEAAIAGARREAEAAFGDPTVFLERHLQRPRHIEIQVLADEHGNAISLGERECSLQRRHQKVLEEAPSAAVDEELRERLGAAAVAAAEAVGYVGAGTVEFLLAGDGEFHFLEMNTRLQVEHPVTELVRGVDLVAEQLRIAAGEPISAAARESRIDGHAIEVRLYAEDAAAGFLPQTGTVERLRIAGAEPFAVPEPGRPPAALRLDSGVEDGTVIGPHYDPMLAKVIAWAPTREEAAARLAAALADAEIDGLTTNRDLLVRLLRAPAVLAGETDTDLLEREPAFAEPLVGAAEERLHAAAAALAAMAARREEAPVLAFAPSGFRNNFSEPQRIVFESDASRTAGDVPAAEGADQRPGAAGDAGAEAETPRDNAAQIDASDSGSDSPAAGDGAADADEESGSAADIAPALEVRYALRREGLELAVGGAALEGARLHAATPGLVDLEVGGLRRRYRVRRSGSTHYVNGPAGQSTLRELPRHPLPGERLAEGALIAPMPGKVLKLGVEAGSEVAAGDVLVVLEAMKMEHELTAPAAGTVTELLVAESDQVDSGAPLAVIEPARE